MEGLRWEEAQALQWKVDEAHGCVAAAEREGERLGGSNVFLKLFH